MLQPAHRCSCSSRWARLAHSRCQNAVGCQRRLHHLQKTALRESDYQLEAPHARKCEPCCELHEAYGSGDGVDMLTCGLARRVSILMSVKGASVGRALTMRTWQ